MRISIDKPFYMEFSAVGMIVINEVMAQYNDYSHKTLIFIRSPMMVTYGIQGLGGQGKMA